MKKPVIDAMEALTDIRAGLDDVDLMEKYNLSARGLQSLFKKLAALGFLDKKTMDVVMPSRESVPPDGVKHVSGKQFLIDFRSGISDKELMRKHGLSSRELEILFGKLLDAGLITEAELEEQAQGHQMDTTVDVREDQLPQGFPITGVNKKIEPTKTPAGTMPPARKPDVLPKSSKNNGAELEVADPSNTTTKEKPNSQPVENTVLEPTKAPWKCPVCHSPQAMKAGQCPTCGFVTTTSIEMVAVDQQTTQIVASQPEESSATQELEIVEEEDTPKLEFEKSSKTGEPSTEQRTTTPEPDQPLTEQMAPKATVEQADPPQIEATPTQADTVMQETENETPLEEKEPPRQDLRHTLQRLEKSLNPPESTLKSQGAKVTREQPHRRTVLERQKASRHYSDLNTTALEERASHLKTELYGKLLVLANVLKWFGTLQLPIVFIACALGVVSAIVTPLGFTFSSWITIISLAAIISIGVFILFRVIAAGISLAVDVWAEIHTTNVLLQKIAVMTNWDKDEHSL